MRELPEPAIKPSELIVPVGVGGGLYTEKLVLAIQKQAYEDGLRDAANNFLERAVTITNPTVRLAMKAHANAMLTASQKEQQ